MRRPMKLSEYATKNSISYETARELFHEGKIPGARKPPGGRILIYPENTPEMKTVTYARTPNRMFGLERQSQTLRDYCHRKGWEIHKEYKEEGSGLNESRKDLTEILTSPDPLRVVVERKDVLTRFGFTYIQCIVENNGGEIVTIFPNASADRDELKKDFVTLVNTLFIRIYGNSKGRDLSEKFQGIIK